MTSYQTYRPSKNCLILWMGRKSSLSGMNTVSNPLPWFWLRAPVAESCMIWRLSDKFRERGVIPVIVHTQLPRLGLTLPPPSRIDQKNPFLICYGNVYSLFWSETQRNNARLQHTWPGGQRHTPLMHWECPVHFVTPASHISPGDASVSTGMHIWFLNRLTSVISIDLLRRFTWSKSGRHLRSVIQFGPKSVQISKFC